MPGGQCPRDLFPVVHWATPQAIPTDPISRRSLLETFVKSYADHQIQLAKVRFETICQLEYHTCGDIIEGPIRQDDHPFIDRRRLGPFKSLGAFHVARIDNLLCALRDRVDEVWTPEERTEYLILSECRRWIKMSKWMNKERSDFYLRHQLDSLDNYLVTDGKLSGVTEWQE